VGDHELGIMGLKRALEEIAHSHASKTDAEVKEALLERLTSTNYIPNSARDDYGRAFVREFRKALGQPYEEIPDAGLRIAVLGPGCSQCNTLEQVVIQVLSELDLPASLEHVTDVKEIARYGFLKMPALVINGKIMATGTVPSAKKIKELLAALDRS
jgi:small redox-active disulfide protein 2